MSINRGIRLSVAVAVLGVAASVTFAAPAQAAVNPAACKYSYDRYREHVSATCYDDNLSRWQLRPTAGPSTTTTSTSTAPSPTDPAPARPW